MIFTTCAATQDKTFLERARKPRKSGSVPGTVQVLTLCFSNVGFSKVLKAMTADSTREELLSFIQQYGSHYVSEALYGSELSCNIYFPSKKAQQQLWLQYQKGKGGRVRLMNR